MGKKETIKFTTTFSDRNIPKGIKNNVHWGGGCPNGIYLDYSYEPPEKTEHFTIKGKNLLSDNDAFLEKNKIFKTLNNIQINYFDIVLWEDNYLNLKKKLLDPSHKSPTYQTRRIGEFWVDYDDSHLYDVEGSGEYREESECVGENDFVHMINFQVLVDSEEFNQIFKKIKKSGTNSNYEFTINFNDWGIAEHDENKHVTTADVIDFKIL
tara:strand:+ start:86 stop:715 length:630 start_codon:yes stop_codon:yes gene_type:complete